MHDHGAHRPDARRPGDEVLRHFANALRMAARSTDILARIGGDEFGVLLVAQALE